MNLALLFIKKGILLIIMLLILSFIVFYLAHFSPGDPLQSFYGDALQFMNQHEIAAAKHRLGLDGSIFSQYINWLSNMLQGNLGFSLKYKRPVIEIIPPLIKNTLLLGGIAYLLVFMLAILLALICIRYEDTWLDRFICRAGTATYYIPAFWLAILIILIFSINLKWFPASGAYSFGEEHSIINRMQHMVLPLVVMVLSHLWYYTYIIRSRLLDQVRCDYVLLARAKGLGKTYILLHHCLRNVLPTLINLIAISISHILSGTYVVEAVFNYQGIGLLSVESAKYHDYNVLMIMILLTGALVIIGSLVAQIINEFLDPRIKSDKLMVL